jgi:hypothetical protein
MAFLAPLRRLAAIEFCCLKRKGHAWAARPDYSVAVKTTAAKIKTFWVRGEQIQV